MPTLTLGMVRPAHLLGQAWVQQQGQVIGARDITGGKVLAPQAMASVLAGGS